MQTVARDQCELVSQVPFCTFLFRDFLPAMRWVGDRTFENFLSVLMDENFKRKAVGCDWIKIDAAAATVGKREEMMRCSLSASRFDVGLRQRLPANAVVALGDHQRVWFSVCRVEHPPTT
jgi:hypothetical protein